MISSCCIYSVVHFPPERPVCGKRTAKSTEKLKQNQRVRNPLL